MAKEKKVVTTTTTTKAVKPVKEKKRKVITTVTTTVTKEVISTPLNEKTHIICILDRSGSMSSIMSDSIGGFNTFLKQQKALPDKATITVALFDDKYDLLYDNVDIKRAEELTNKVWYPRGTTALFDAIGKTINNEKLNFARLGSEAPAKVLVCVVTDGLENASREYKRSDIQNLIRQCENDDWNFIYLAANQDAFAVGMSFGISAGNTFTYTPTAAGVSFMSATLNCATTSYRGMSSSNTDFKTKSKSLIDNPDKKTGDAPENNAGGSITTNGTNNISYTVSNIKTDNTVKVK
jgi:hypothetical protein